MTSTRSIARHLTWALPFLAVAACDGTSRPEGDPNLVRSDKARITSPQVKPEEVDQVVAGNAAFALDLYQAIRAKPDVGNLFYSPHSISSALAMAYAGAEGRTESQMKETLHFPLGEPALHAAFNRLDLDLSSRSEVAAETGGKGFRLNVVNALWGQKGYTFLPTFLDALAENYGAGLRVLDFAGGPETARQTINGWVEDQTEDKIKDLLPEDAVGPDTVLVLTNAIYFNAAWLEPFPEAATQTGTFDLLEGGQVSVPMMRQAQGRNGYFAGEGYQAVELLYEGRELSMVVVVPDKGTFGDFEKAWTADQLSETLTGLRDSKVDLTLPKFRYEHALDLEPVLIDLGMTDAFGAADFSGIDGGGGLFIGDVIHKAFVGVDEKGTEAAAATGVSFPSSIPPGPFTVLLDRPFVFVIRDLQTGAILFVGRVVNPA
jgi:serpin B